MNALASPTNDPTPTLSGGAGVEAGDEPTVTVTIYEGATVGGTVAASESVTASGAAWSYTAAHLTDGTYTAQASQSDDAGNLGRSAPVTFTVDTTPPVVTMNALASPTKNATPTLTGAAGVAAGDDATITVKIHEGASVAGKTVVSGSALLSGSRWSYKSTHLADGTYTAQAEQSDDAGNVGKSGAVTFTVDTTPPVVTINSLVSPTNNPEPTLTGGAGVATGDSRVTVTIYAGACGGGHPRATAARRSTARNGRTRRRN